MEGFDEVINAYEATVNVLMTQKARKDDVEMKKREEVEDEIEQGFSKKLKITEMIKSYMEWSLDSKLVDLEIIKRQQEFIKKMVEIVGEYSNNEEKVEEANQMLKEADAAIDGLKKEKSDKFHECARYKSLLKDALKLVPKAQRRKFVNEKIKGIKGVESDENYSIDVENTNNESESSDGDTQKEFDNIESETPDKVCLECGDDISDRGTSAKYCDECKRKMKYTQSYASRVRGKQKLKKRAELPEPGPDVTV